MDVRWAGSNVDQMQVLAKELVDLQPDVILANSTPVTAAFQRETQTIPIVFTRNLKIDYRFVPGTGTDEVQRAANELVASRVGG